MLEFPNAGPLVSWFSFLFSRSGLEPVLLRGTDVEFVHTELDEFLRIAASINDGCASAGVAQKDHEVKPGSYAIYLSILRHQLDGAMNARLRMA
jgi:hypothetical protein